MSTHSKIIPGAITEYISQSYLSTVKTKSIFIYSVTIIAFFAILISLPFITTSVSVQSSAIIRPTSEISTLRSLVNGRLKESFAAENKAVAKGETLFVVESEMIKAQQKTIIIIAHRLSTVFNADKIVVLDKGNVKEEGKHDELMYNRKQYYQLWKQQFPMLDEISN